MNASPLRTIAVNVVSDLAMLYSLLGVSMVVRVVWGGEVVFSDYVMLFSCLLLAVPVYAILGLYPAMLLPPQEEVRKLSYGTSILFAVSVSLTFFTRAGTDYSRLTLIMFWLLALLVLPIWRGFIKSKFSLRPWWGSSVIICGNNEWLETFVTHLYCNPRLGLKPSAVVSLDEEGVDNRIMTFSVPEGARLENYEPGSSASSISLPCYSLNNLPAYEEGFNYPYAFMVLHSLDKEDRERMAFLSRRFKKTFFVFSFLEHLNCWSAISDLAGVLAIETRQKLLDKRRQRVKRVIDLMLTLFGAVVFVPLTIFLGILIKLEDGGPIFYAHPRVGREGKKIKVLKFRTMVKNADKILKEYLATDESLAREWAETHKLRNDPRITRVGRWLRKTSLDELPQVFNVFMGDLSFVGPRPIVEAEIEKYKNGYDLYTSVLPGLTGYWQISGRSNTSYERRVELDSYYIRNWSVWLDIYIIASTPKALLNTDSAC